MKRKKEYNVTCIKCGKDFKAKLSDSKLAKKFTFFCGKCAMKMIESGEF